jgi:glycosyltransferase involved in cell wall biosynthesis
MDLVTIAIPTYNRSDLLVRAVKSALAQDHASVEVLVSDNASTDDTPQRMAEIQDPRLRYVRQTRNLGMVGNFNYCLEAAKGDLFLMLSDDDLMEPEAVRHLSQPFREGMNGTPAGNIGLTWCPCMIINAAGDPLWETGGGPTLESSESAVLAHFNGERGQRFCSIMVRTEDARAVGGYNEQRYGALCDTANWTLAVLRHETAVCINQPLILNTSHTRSATSRSNCVQWQVWGANMNADISEALRGRGVKERQIKSATRNELANVTVTILIPNIGKPGWISYVAAEVLRSWKLFLTPYVVRRLFRESWKLMRFWRQERTA